MATRAQVAAGVYRSTRRASQPGWTLFRREQFAAARDEWSRADPGPARRAHAVLRRVRRTTGEGWGRFHHDDALYRQGLAAAERAQRASPRQRPGRSDDPDLKMRNAAELKAEIERGLRAGPRSDFNPLRVMEPRK